MGRAPCCEKVGLKRGRWTAEEDEILTKYILANGEGSWRSLPRNAGLLRCGKSCRLRWFNYLRADLKRGNISVEEEDVIIKLRASLGNKWSLIANQLPGRTDNEIKNYWNSHLSRKIDTFRRGANKSESLPIIMNLDIASLKRKGGRTSRAAVKKQRSYTANNKSLANKAPSQKAKDSKIIDNGEMPLPPTPTLGKESLPSAIWGEEKMGKNLVIPSPYQEITGGRMLGSGEEIESLVFQARESCKRNSMLCPSDELGTVMLGGPYEGFEDSGGILPFNDIMCSELIVDPNGALNLTVEEERERNNSMASGEETESGVMGNFNNIAKSEDLRSGNLSSNEESGEFLSCSSRNPNSCDGGRVDWDWEGFVHWNLWNDQQEQSDVMLSWLWDSDNGKGDNQDNFENQEAMVAWLLS